MNQNARNEAITRLLVLKKKLSEKRKYFSLNLDSNNSLSVLSEVIKAAKENDIINEKEESGLVARLEEDSKNANDVFLFIEEQINTSLKNLGYGNEQVNNQEVPSKDSNEEIVDIVQTYNNMIDSLEKMIDELSKNMKILEGYIKKISDKINYSKEKVVSRKPEEQEESPSLDLSGLMEKK